jgi:hypothetical protein
MMQQTRKIIPFLLMALGLAVILASCGTQVVTQEVPVVTTVEVVVTQVVTVEVEPEAPMAPAVEVPFEALWAASGHNNAEAEAFIHWNEDDPKVVPIACAKCHSTPGYQDFLGADGSEFGVVDADHPVGTTIQCVACHNDVTLTLTSVVMPSGVEITGLGDEARCMQCHQGRESKISVDAAIETAGVDDDTVSADLGFRNIHYYAAAATKYGTIAKGGYEYDGMSYDANFAHVDGYDTCIGCHNPHTLAVKVEECRACHTDVTDVEDLKNVRMPSSGVDYDGDGDLTEGIYYELEGLRDMLYQAIQAYGEEVAGSAVVYDAASYPYFFDGAGERYVAWTPRLLRAAYNYQVSLKDPGAFAHGGKYIIELLYDSIADLNTVLSSPVDLSAAHRIDHGHFAGSEEAFRHWDADPAVPASCSKCHSAAGLPLFLTEGGVSISQPQANGFQCATCHNDLSTWTRYEVASVTFPSGATIDSGNQNTNLCMNCHQGRSSSNDVSRLTDGKPDDATDESLRFLNIHYFAAGATRYGTEVKGAYEYDGKTYLGYFEHVPTMANCTDCHSAHQLTVEVEKCGACHAGVATVADLETIRIDPTDWDGDGDTTEGIAGEVETMAEKLYAAMQAYAEANADTAPIVYNPAAYPYFFNDAGDSYSTWTPSLLKAAYNYQYSQKDPGAFAHNGKYVLQFLYDGIQDLGGDVAGMTRP